MKLEPLTNGAVNSTYKFFSDDEPYVLRVYLRDPNLCEIEREVIQLVQSRVQVPELISSDPKGKPHPSAVFRFVEGKHLFDAPDVSYELGITLAKIHQIRFDQAGLFGPGLSLDPVFEKGSRPYYEYIKENLTEDSIAWKRLGEPLASKTLQFVDTHKDFFPVIGEKSSLVHSDFKPVNLLWSNEDGITVLDWEFAHSGDPLIDFAVLLRHRNDFPLNTDNLEKGYRQEGGSLPEDWIKRASITDIINIVQLLNSTLDRPELYDFLLMTLEESFFLE